MSGLSLGTCLSNLKSIALTVLELLAFNAQIFRSRDPGHEKILRGHVQTVPGNMLVKFEVRSFNRFKLVWLTGLLCTQETHTERQTHIKRTHYLRYSLRSLGGDNNKQKSISKTNPWPVATGHIHGQWPLAITTSSPITYVWHRILHH